jgi:hypothetical protein
MSVISFPRRVEPQPRRATPSHPRRESPRTTQRSSTPARRVVKQSRWSRLPVTQRAGVIVVVALVISLTGSMLEANRQVELHQLQSNLLQMQSNYAEQVGSSSNPSAPSQIASQAGAMHLVNPTQVFQVPSTSLDAPLPTPKFYGYAPATSRTIR